MSTLTALPDVEAAAERVVPVRRWWRWLTAAVALLVFAAVVTSVAGNSAFQWPVVLAYLFDPAVLGGLALSLWLTAATTALGFLLGMGLAVTRMSGNPVLSALSWGYIWIFRSTPLIVQLLFWFTFGAVSPKLTLGVPFGPGRFTTDTTTLLSGTVLTTVQLHVEKRYGR